MSAPLTFAGMISGRRVDLLAPDWREIDLSDVAYGLASIRRWNGQALRQISVAEHSATVASLVEPPQRLAALLHDAHEFALGDIIRPTHAAIAALAPEAAPAIERLKYTLDVAIARRALAAFGPTFSIPLQEAEASALADEMRSAAVTAADGAAARLEEAQLGRGQASGLAERGDPRALARAFGFRHARAEADLWEARIGWLVAVRAAVEARYAEAADG